ncbi:restriction endonuclease [Mariprofundus sp. NF]|uniref:restriction endonuclease n=1 Tax=Mariprofundus sp. NF TaxID=2608716 RepID=UPI0015A3E2B2|nr:restriction endonuclease [Mariprofundus sp. NF]NWF39820.1 restriction endonuclease [Mariprofundus sp. NF]
MDKTPRIATYDRRKLFLWPEGSPAIYDSDDHFKSLIATEKCDICNKSLIFEKNHTESLDEDFYYILICPSCGYWKGRACFDNSRLLNGTFFELIHDFGINGRIRKLPLDSREISTVSLLKYLSSHHSNMTHMNPFRAEKFVMDLLGDWFECDVTYVGGSKDGGVDGYLLKNNDITSIIQVKWRREINKAESISTIRELAGSMLVNNVPNGYLVTTRDHVSSQSKQEIESINDRSIAGIGQLSIGYKAYNDLIDMIDLSFRKMSDSPKLEIDGIEPYDVDALFNIDDRDNDKIVIEDDDFDAMKIIQENTALVNQADMALFLHENKIIKPNK